MAKLVAQVGNSSGGGGGPAIVLARGQDITFYMSPTGNDANDGLSAGSAIQTIPRLNELINTVQFNGFTGAGAVAPVINISMAAGTYEGGTLCAPALGFGEVLFNSGPSSVIVAFASAIDIRNFGFGVRVYFNNCTFQPAGWTSSYPNFANALSPVTGTTANGNAISAPMGPTSLARFYMLWGGYYDNNEYATVIVHNSYADFANCTFGTNGQTQPSPIIVENSGRARVRTATIRLPMPIAICGDSSELNLENSTLAYASTTTMRYLVAMGGSSMVNFKGSMTNTSNNLRAQYLVRAGSGGHVRVNNQWASLIGFSPTFANGGVVDNEYSGGGTYVQSYNAGGQTLLHRTYRRNASAIIKANKHVGKFYVFYGSGVVCTIRPDAFGISDPQVRSQSAIFAAKDGATLLLDLATAANPNAIYYINGLRLVGSTSNVSWPTGTTIEVRYLSMQEVAITVLETPSVGGGGTALQFQDEGANLGGPDADTINVTGVATATRTGNTITLNVPAGGGARELLTTTRDYYVATTGNDGNSGLTAGSPFLTIGKAITEAAKLDISVFDVNINIADGTYNAPVTLLSITGSGRVNIIGNTASPQNVVLTNAGTVVNGLGYAGIYDLRGFTITSSGGNCIYLNGGGQLNLYDIIFGSAGSVHIAAQNGSQIFLRTSYTITGDAAYHVYAVGPAAQVSYNLAPANPITVTLAGPGVRAFSSAFAIASGLGTLEFYGPAYCVFSGTATGPRFICDNNAVIRVGGAGLNYLPGNAAGTQAFGGVYN